MGGTKPFFLATKELFHEINMEREGTRKGDGKAEHGMCGVKETNRSMTDNLPWTRSLCYMDS